MVWSEVGKHPAFVMPSERHRYASRCMEDWQNVLVRSSGTRYAVRNDAA